MLGQNREEAASNEHEKLEFRNLMGQLSDLAQKGYFPYKTKAVLPLCMAANYNDYPMITYLLEQGADLQAARRQALKLQNQAVIDVLTQYN